MEVQLTADVYLYPTAAGGKKIPMQGIFSCPCFLQRDTKAAGYDCRILVGETPFKPGERRRVGFVFLSGQQAVARMRETGRFFLWEGRFIGEANVDPDN
jgi:hypothetical protein